MTVSRHIDLTGAQTIIAAINTPDDMPMAALLTLPTERDCGIRAHS
jgi:hypothetical protein